MSLYEFLAEHLPPKPRERPDGDTGTMRVDLGMQTLRVTKYRLARINCPELSTGAAGYAARDHTRLLWPFGVIYHVRTFIDPTDKYGRWITEVTLPDGSLLSDALVVAGHAVYQEY